MLDFVRSGGVRGTGIDRLARSIGDLQDIIPQCDRAPTEQAIDTNTAGGKS